MGPRGIGPGALWVDLSSPYFFQFRVPLIGVKRWFEALNGKIYHFLSHIFRTESVKYNHQGLCLLSSFGVFKAVPCRRKLHNRSRLVAQGYPASCEKEDEKIN